MALSSHQWLKAVNQGQVLCSVYSESQAAASCLRPLFLPVFTSVPMVTAPPSPKRLELGPRLFWLRSKVFSCCVYPELAVTSPSEEWVQWCWTELRREREGKVRGGWEGGTKSGGRQAQGGGRAKNQEHYIIAGAESEREGYESVDSLSLSLSVGWQPTPLCISPQYFSWSWDCWDWDSKAQCVYKICRLHTVDQGDVGLGVDTMRGPWWKEIS